MGKRSFGMLLLLLYRALNLQFGGLNDGILACTWRSWRNNWRNRWCALLSRRVARVQISGRPHLQRLARQRPQLAVREVLSFNIKINSAESARWY
jgi:hypothetical protein